MRHFIDVASDNSHHCWFIPCFMEISTSTYHLLSGSFYLKYVWHYEICTGSFSRELTFIEYVMLLRCSFIVSYNPHKNLMKSLKENSYLDEFQWLVHGSTKIGHSSVWFFYGHMLFRAPAIDFFEKTFIPPFLAITLVQRSPDGADFYPLCSTGNVSGLWC